MTLEGLSLLEDVIKGASQFIRKRHKTSVIGANLSIFV